jgi:CheY-like chemotaxis protein
MAQGGAQFKVLVVDSNASFRRLVASILRSASVAEVIEASNGSEAFELISTYEPNLAFVDWHVEPMGGTEFVTYIRTSPQSPNPFMPVIVLTGYSYDGLAQEVRAIGADDFVAKPISPRILLGRMMRAIQSPRPYVRGGRYLGPDRRRSHKNPVATDRRKNA